MLSSIHVPTLADFPQVADFLHVWALYIADNLRPLGIDFPPATWGLGL